MRFHRWIIGAAVLALLLSLMGCGLIAHITDEHEEEITLAELPTAVREAVEREAPGATIREIERETERGVTTYEVEVIEDGVEVELEFDPDGTLLEREIDD